MLLLGVVVTQIVTCTTSQKNAASVNNKLLQEAIVSIGCPDEGYQADCLKAKKSELDTWTPMLDYYNGIQESYESLLRRMYWQCSAGLSATPTDCLGELVLWRDRMSIALGCQIDKDQAACVTKKDASADT